MKDHENTLVCVDHWSSSQTCEVTVTRSFHPGPGAVVQQSKASATSSTPGMGEPLMVRSLPNQTMGFLKLGSPLVMDGALLQMIGIGLFWGYPYFKKQQKQL